MERPQDNVSVITLKRLLVELKEKRPDICIRYRSMGALWNRNFTKVVLVTERGALFNDEVLNKLITVRDLSVIMQFELDNRFQNFHPHFHYNLDPSW
jgi:hypothetical protein